MAADAVAFQGHSYKYFGERLSWKEAKARCEALGGHLPIVETAAENAFLDQLAHKSFPAANRDNKEAVWLGATDEVKEGEWRWIDGSRVAYAHGRGILHRNVTPGHILIGRDWSQIKLGDLMLAKAVDDCGERITRPGELVGNLRYLAPEQLAGDGWIDHRADLYSLGATLYAVLTGRPPFDGATTGEIVHAVRAGRVEPPSRQHMGIPPAFEWVVLRMMARARRTLRYGP